MFTRGRVRVTLRARVDVDDLGFITRTGVGHVWAAVVNVPMGAEVVVDLGPARHVNRQVIDVCAEHLEARQTVVFESSDPNVAMAWALAGLEVSP